MNSIPSIDLQSAAGQVAKGNGFEPEFPSSIQQQPSDLATSPPQLITGSGLRDLRSLPWSSIDNYGDSCIFHREDEEIAEITRRRELDAFRAARKFSPAGEPSE